MTSLVKQTRHKIIKSTLHSCCLPQLSCKTISNPSRISRMSHIYKLHYNDHKNAINAANKMVEAGQKRLLVKHCYIVYSQKSYAVKPPHPVTEYFIDIGLTIGIVSRTSFRYLRTNVKEKTLTPTPHNFFLSSRYRSQVYSYNSYKFT